MPAPNPNNPVKGIRNRPPAGSLHAVESCPCMRSRGGAMHFTDCPHSELWRTTRPRTQLPDENCTPQLLPLPLQMNR